MSKANIGLAEEIKINRDARINACECLVVTHYVWDGSWEEVMTLLGWVTRYFGIGT